MKRRQQPLTDNKQARFLLSGVRVFINNRELSEMSIQNEYGGICVRRETPPPSAVHAVGFDITDYNDDTGDEDE